MANEIITFRDAKSGELLLSLPRRGEVGIDFVIGALLAMLYTDKCTSVVVAAEQDSSGDPFGLEYRAEYHGKEDVDLSTTRFMRIHSLAEATRELKGLFGQYTISKDFFDPE